MGEDLLPISFSLTTKVDDFIFWLFYGKSIVFLLLVVTSKASSSSSFSDKGRMKSHIPCTSTSSSSSVGFSAVDTYSSSKSDSTFDIVFASLGS